MTAISGLGVANSSAFATANQGVSAVGNQPSAFDKILDDFKKAAFETPAERAAQEVLKKHGITQDQLGTLPKDKQDAIQREIAEAVKRTLKVDGKTGSSDSVSAIA